MLGGTAFVRSDASPEIDVTSNLPKEPVDVEDPLISPVSWNPFVKLPLISADICADDETTPDFKVLVNKLPSALMVSKLSFPKLPVVVEDPLIVPECENPLVWLPEISEAI